MHFFKFRLILFTALFIKSNFGWSQGYVEFGRTTQANIDMTMNNLGIIGNSFRGVYSASQGGWGSCEYPRGSGIEHIFNGGLWIGGKIEGNTIAVSTGAISSSQGYSTGASGYEFTAPIGSKLLQRSILLDNQFYNPKAISHQDLVGDFTDRNILVPGSQQQIVNHRQPLFVDVHFEAYNWNFSSANFFVPLNFTIKNTSDKRIDSIYVGFWSDFVVRNVNINPPGGTPFFSGGGNAYIDSLQIAYEYDAENLTANAKSYIGVKFLGAEDKSGFLHPRSNANFKVKYNTWQFSSGNGYLFGPTNDNENYQRLSIGLNEFPNWTQIQREIAVRGNRSNLLSAGPFASLEPNQELNISFAIVCAPNIEDGNAPYLNTNNQRREFIRNARLAQSSYLGEDKNFNGTLESDEDLDNNGKITRWVFPEPPALPKTKIIASDNKVELYWNNNANNSIDPVSRQKDFEGYNIYKTQIGFDVQGERNIEEELKLVASFDSSGNLLFYDTGFDSIRLAQPVLFEGDTTKYYYKYTFKNLANGWQHAIALTAFDRGDKNIDLPSLETSKLANLYRVFPGKPANKSLSTNQPFIYPNPYYGFAAWEGGSRFEEDRKMTFANLPANCKIKIFTYSGDLVDEINHNQSYSGNDIRWYNTYANDATNTVFSGGEHSWDLLSRNSQLISRGLYLFSVEDTDTGKVYPGKFAIVK